ncbi:MAG: flippase [Patescibacteria group bacterium]|nr:flippase [Patescibacteria group bacterium]MDE2015281.1 flippase [Patescibacteria group bacterium]MDE2227087.1 flippase [Patescibacteria group bacterium]
MFKKIKGLLFQNQTTRQTIAKNTFWLGLSNIGGRLIRSAIIIYSARVLGAAEWGVFSYALALAAFVTSFTDVGINPIIVRETNRLKSEPMVQKQIVSTSFVLKLLLVILSAVLILFLAPHFTSEPGIKAILPIVVFIVIFDTFRELGNAIARSLEKMEWEAGLYFLTNIAIVIFGFIALYTSKTVTALTYAYAAGTGVGMLASVVILKDYLSGLFKNFYFKWVKHILAIGWPMALSGVLGSLMISTDILIIGWLRSTQDVGLYSAAQRIVQLLYLIPATLAWSLLPIFSRLAASNDKRRKRDVLERALGIMYLVAIPTALGGILLGTKIIGFVFGSPYLGGTFSFQMLMATILIDFPITIITLFIFANNRQKNITIYAAIGGACNVIFDLILIPRFGINGSAVATFLAQLISNIYVRYAAKKIDYFQIVRHLKKIIIAAAIMSCAIIVIKNLQLNVIIDIIIGAAIYFLALLALKEPLFKELKFILRPAASASPESNGPSSV